MRTIRFDPSQLQDPQQQAWWRKWQQRADDARDKLLDEWRLWEQQPVADRTAVFKPSFNEDIWSDLKHWLSQHVFIEKCAYCESPLDLDRYGGDAEHFRPKGRVTFRDDRGASRIVTCQLGDGQQVQHPGYFWLAYDWRNLMPACSRCNSGDGKVDQFPVRLNHFLQHALPADGSAPLQAGEGIESPPKSRRYFLAPQRLDSLETPLLLNPLNPDGERAPEKHLRFGLGGVVVAVDGSPLGLASIRTYGLDKGVLNRRRQKEQDNAARRFYAALMNSGGDPMLQAEAILKDLRGGQGDYPSAAYDRLSAELSTLKKLAVARGDSPP